MKEKADFRIGQRAFDFIKKQEGTMVDKCKKLGAARVSYINGIWGLIHHQLITFKG